MLNPQRILAPALLAICFALAEASALPPTDYPPGGGKAEVPGPGGGENPEGKKDGGKGQKKDGKKDGDGKTGAKKGDKKGGKKGAKNGNAGGKDKGKGKGKGKGKPGGPPFEVTTGVVQRTPTTRTASGEARPPWTRIDIARVGLRGEAEAGKQVTVVPFSEKADTIRLPVVKAIKRPHCAATGKPWYALTLGPVGDPKLARVPPNRYRDADKPIDAAIIYPAQKEALFIEPLLIPKSDIPAKFLPKTLVGGGRPQQRRKVGPHVSGILLPRPHQDRSRMFGDVHAGLLAQERQEDQSGKLGVNRPIGALLGGHQGRRRAGPPAFPRRVEMI